jgi:hypothetical protein
MVCVSLFLALPHADASDVRGALVDIGKRLAKAGLLAEQGKDHCIEALRELLDGVRLHIHGNVANKHGTSGRSSSVSAKEGCNSDELT